MDDGRPMRLVRAILRLLPRDLRAEYAAEIEELVRTRRVEMGRTPLSHRVGFWTSEIRGALGAVVTAWLDRSPRRGGLGQDIRYALRAIRRSPAISAAIILTLAVGLGATLTVLTMLDGLLLHPVPVSEPDRVVRVYQAFSETAPYGGTAFPTLEDYRRGSPSLSGPAGFTTLDVGLAAGQVTDRVSAGLVSGDFFDILGVGAAVGRTLQSADDRPDAPPVVMLGHALWERVFGSEPEVVGRIIQISGAPFEVVGVAPRGFQGVSLAGAPDLWLPLARIQEAASSGLYSAPNLFETRAFAWISLVGRLKPGVTAERAEAELERVALAVRDELGDDSGVPEMERPMRVLPLETAAAGADRTDLLRFMGLLGGVVLITLGVACVNAAHLVSARAWTRSHELGVRRALGAGRGRIIRHLLAESVLLAVAGGGLGLALAGAATRLLQSFVLPGGIPISRLNLALDGRTAAAALALSLLTAVAFGLGPALAQSRASVADRLRERTRGSTGGARGLSVMITAQVGMALVLLTGAFLFARTLARALDTDLGFEPERVAALSLAFRGHGYDAAEIPDILRRLVDEAVASPEVEVAAFATHVPLAPPSMRLRPVREDAGDEASPIPMGVNVVTPGYFEVLGIPVLEGRGLSGSDTEDAEEVAVMNRTAADLMWPGEASIGGRFMLVRGLDPVRVVGIVETHKVHSVGDAEEPYVYLSAAQNAQLVANGVHFIARGVRDGRDGLAALRSGMRSLDSTLPTFDARLVGEQMARVLMPQRFGILLLGLLSAVALVVSAIGVYGMVTFGVRRRTREIGIRMALGARPRHVLLTVAGGTLSAVLVGIALGTGLAVVLGRYLETYLMGGVSRDPVAIGAAVLVLAVAGLVAALIPAGQAVRLHPDHAMATDD